MIPIECFIFAWKYGPIRTKSLSGYKCTGYDGGVTNFFHYHWRSGGMATLPFVIVVMLMPLTRTFGIPKVAEVTIQRIIVIWTCTVTAR